MHLVFIIELIYKKIYLFKNSYLSKSCNDFFQMNNASISNYLFQILIHIKFCLWYVQIIIILFYGGRGRLTRSEDSSEVFLSPFDWRPFVCLFVRPSVRLSFLDKRKEI